MTADTGSEIDNSIRADSEADVWTNAEVLLGKPRQHYCYARQSFHHGPACFADNAKVDLLITEPARRVKTARLLDERRHPLVQGSNKLRVKSVASKRLSQPRVPS